MITLMKKMKRDLIKMWSQFLSVLIMAFLGVGIYSGMEGVWNGMDKIVEDFYSDTNMADAWVYGKGLENYDINRIREIEGVNNVAGTMTLNSKMDANTLSYSKGEADVKLMTYSENSLSKLWLVDGEDFDENLDGIWLSRDFAEERNINSGDCISLTCGKVSKNLKVNGIILTPEYIFYTGPLNSISPDFSKYGVAYISEKSAENMFGKVIYNEVKIDLNEDVDFKEFQKSVEGTLVSKYYGFADRGSLKSSLNVRNKIVQIRKMSILFSIVFIILAILTMQTAMTRLIENQRIQIATLKALGFGNKKILLHYSMYGLFVGVIGSILGLILGPITISPVLLKICSNMYSLPEYKIHILIMSFTVALFIILCCVISTVFAARKGLKGMPAETMRGESPNTAKKSRFSGKIDNISLGWRWSLRDMTVNKVRVIMGIIGIAGCMMLLIASFGIKNSLQGSNDYIYNAEYTNENKAVIWPTASEENKERLVQTTDDNDAQWLCENSVEIKKEDKIENAVISIIDEGKYINFIDDKKENVDLPSEGIMLSRKTSELLNAKVGDKVAIRIPGELSYEDVTIEEIVTNPSPQGVFISKKAWTEMGNDFNPTSLLFGESSNIDKIKDLPFVEEVTDRQSQLESADSILDQIVMVSRLLKGAAILLGIVILYNLGVLSFTERVRDYATLKVLGFFNNEIKSFARRENVITTIIGWIIGIPVGSKFLKIYVSKVSTSSFECMPFLTVMSFVLSTIITVGCSIGVNIFLNSRIKKIDMVGALKAVE